MKLTAAVEAYFTDHLGRMLQDGYEILRVHGHEIEAGARLPSRAYPGNGGVLGAPECLGS